jgi:hypothetical protein
MKQCIHVMMVQQQLHVKIGLLPILLLMMRISMIMIAMMRNQPLQHGLLIVIYFPFIHSFFFAYLQPTVAPNQSNRWVIVLIIVVGIYMFFLILRGYCCCLFRSCRRSSKATVVALPFPSPITSPHPVTARYNWCIW